MKKELVFVTVIGRDRKGIIATLSTYLFKQGINIEDISQKVIRGYFVMTMLVDVSEAKRPLEAMTAGLIALGDKLNMRIQVQHENIFKMMHRV